MPSTLITGPASEPITLAEAKTFLRVETDDDNDVITALIAGSRIHVEAATRRALITQTWRVVRDAWPEDGCIALAPAPLRQVTAARVYREDGSTQSIDVAAFVVDKASVPPRLAFAPWALPAPERTIAGIEIDIEVGYGAASAVPEPLRQAIRLLVAHWYENRGLVKVGHEVAQLPAMVTALIAPFRVLSL